MSLPSHCARRLAGGLFPLLALAAVLSGIKPVQAQTLDDYAALPLEELLTLEVTSVARKRQRVADAAAAVFVVTQEDIRRSGAQTIPELLRMVPGVEVGQIDTQSTALSVRGFNTRFANSLLVMIDGRSIYVSPLSGVLWDQQMVPIDSIERIEVVRGPGATLWGSNAVNGVINIITKHSVDTQGVGAAGFVGGKERNGSLYYGGRVGDTLSYRLYGTIRDVDSLTDADGKAYNDGWTGGQLGFRLDYEPSASDAFTLQGDVQLGDYEYTNVLPGIGAGGRPTLLAQDFDGGFTNFNMLGRWTHEVSDRFDWTAQLYYDRIEAQDLQTDASRDQIDVDVGLRYDINARHELVVGANYRVAWHELIGTGRFVTFDDARDTDQWISGFVQDDIWLAPDRLRLSIGSKFEYNTLSGFDVQPSARLFWRLGEGTSAWGAVSRAVRTPARFETSAVLNLGTIPPRVPPNNSPLPLSLTIVGSEDLKAERLWAYEAGFRSDLTAGWTFDLAAYYNDYSRLRSYTPASLVPVGRPRPTSLALQYLVANDGEGRALGVELALSGPVTDWWKLNLAYSYLDLKIEEELSPLGVPIELQNPGLSPQNQLSLRSEISLTRNLELDAWVRYVDELPGGPVGDYVDLDLRLGYRFTTWGELSLIGQNLLEKRRSEFVQPFYPAPAGYVERSVAAALAVRF